MNYKIPELPERSQKPRENGLTMILDKGLSCRQVEDLIASSHQYADIAKLGFGTSIITNDLKKKLSLYREANIKTCFGGTLFEVFIARGLFDEYRKYSGQSIFISLSCQKLSLPQCPQEFHCCLECIVERIRVTEVVIPQESTSPVLTL